MIKRKPAGAGPSGDAPSRRSSGGGSDHPAHLATVRELARIAAEFELAEIEVEPEGRIRVPPRRTAVRSGMRRSLEPPCGPATARWRPPPPAPSAANEAGALHHLAVRRARSTARPRPRRRSFVEVGTDVRKGQVVCIVEAMKLMNEIEAEADGKVAEILVENGEHVEYGQPLFRLAKV